MNNYVKNFIKVCDDMHSKGLRYSMFSIYSIFGHVCVYGIVFTWKLPISFCKCNVCLFFYYLI